MKAVYLNVKENKKPEVIDIEDKLSNFYRLLDCSTIDVAVRKIGDDYYDIIVDDEGLFVEEPKVSAVDPRGNAQLVGNLLIVKNDGKGELVGLNEDEVAEVLKSMVYVFTENCPDGYYALLLA